MSDILTEKTRWISSGTSRVTTKILRFRSWAHMKIHCLEHEGCMYNGHPCIFFTILIFITLQQIQRM